jgi:lipopolysaccharide/colanic/teichoic acid biosynthesis glycosyltransferase
LVLVAGDLLVLTVVLVAAIGLRQWFGRWVPIEVSGRMALGLLLATLCLPLGFAAAQLYPGHGQGPVERLRKRVTITLYGFGALILFDHLALDGRWSRGILVAAAVLSALALPLWDALAIRFMTGRRLWGEGVLVAGPPDRRRQVVAMLEAHPELGWIPAAEGDLDMAGREPDRSIGVAFVVLPSNSLGAGLNTDDMPFRQVILVPETEGIQSHWVRAIALGPTLGLQVQRNLLMRRNRVLKRFFDVVAAALLLVVSAPVIAIAGLSVGLISPGPFLFGQRRAGYRGAEFRMWKLRSMRTGAEAELARVVGSAPETLASWESRMKIDPDPRVVPVVGRFLRRFSIDELPQFWNVLRGEMSLVGPRPLPDYHLARLSPLAVHLRQQVLPGITGLWQVSGRSETGLDEQERLDVHYVRNWSLWLDLHILSRTLWTVIGGRGAS